MEEREFTLTISVTKVYEVEVTVNASSEESAREQYEDMRKEIAGDATDESLVETEIDLEGCYDPISSLDD